MTSGGGMGGEAAVVYIDLKGRFEQFEARVNALESQAGDAGEKAGNAYGSRFSAGMKIVAGGLLALGAATAAFVKDGFEGMQEGQDAAAQLAAVIKSTGNAAGVSTEHLGDFADEVERTTRFTAEATSSVQSMLLTFTNVKAAGGVFDDATRTALDMAQALGGDASQQAIALGKALNDPVQGITALTRVGVTFSDEQQRVIKSLVETGNTAGAQKVILTELNKEFGGSAAAAGATFSGQMVRLQNAIGAVSESIAIRAMPTVQNLANLFMDKLPEIQDVVDKTMVGVGKAFDYVSANVFPLLIGAFNILKPVVVEGAKVLSDLGSAAIPVLSVALKEGQVVVTALVDGFQKLSVWAERNKDVLIPLATALGTFVVGVRAVSVATAVWTAATTAAATASAALGAAITFLTGPIGIAIAVIALLVGAGIALYRHWDEVKAKASEIWEGVQAVISAAIDKAKGVLKVYIDALTGAFAAGRKLITGDWKGAWETVQSTLKNALDGLDGLFGKSWDKIKNAGLTLGTKLLEGMQAGIDGLQSMIFSALSKALTSLGDRLPAILRPLAAKLANEAQAAADQNAKDADQHRMNVGIYVPTPGISPVGLTPTDYSNPIVAATFQKTGNSLADSVAGWCARWVRLTLDKAEPNAQAQIERFFGGNANDVKNRAISENKLRKDLANLEPGDAVIYDKNHIALYIGNGMVRGNNQYGITQGRGVVSNERINDLGSIAGYVKLADVVKDPKTVSGSTTPKATPTSTPNTPTTVPETAEEVRKRIEAQIKDILARVDIGLISKDAAIKLLSKLDEDATAIARRQGKGWQEYAATAKSADSAIDSLKKGASAGKDVLADLTRQYEYAGKSGLPEYIAGLKAYVSQQEKVVSSTKEGSKAHSEAMDNVIRARRALDQVQKAADLGLSQADVTKFRAGAEEVVKLEKGLTTSTDVEWRRRAQNRIDAYNAQGETAQKVLALVKGTSEQETAVAQARQTALANVNKAVAEGRVVDAQTALNQAKKAQSDQLGLEGKTAAERVQIAQSTAPAILKATYGLNAELKRQKDAEVDAWRKGDEAKALTTQQVDAEVTRRKAANREAERLANVAAQGEQADLLRKAGDAQIAEGQRVADQLRKQAQDTASQRYKLTADLVRYSYGSGQDGLVAALAAETGLSATQVSDNVEAALSDLERLNSTRATLIKSAYAEDIQTMRDAAQALKEEAEGYAESQDALDDVIRSPVAERTFRPDTGVDQAQRETFESLTQTLLDIDTAAADSADQLDLWQGVIENAGRNGALTDKQLKSLTETLNLLKQATSSTEDFSQYADVYDGGHGRKSPLARPYDPQAQQAEAERLTDLIEKTENLGQKTELWRGILENSAQAGAITTKQMQALLQVVENLSKVPAPSLARGDTGDNWRKEVQGAEYTAQAIATARRGFEKMTVAQLENAKSTAKSRAEYDLIVSVLADKSKAAEAAGLLLADAQDRVAAATGKVVLPNEALIKSLLALRGVAGVNQQVLEGLIATLGKLDAQTARQQGIDKAVGKINEFSQYAKNLIPVVTGAMEAFGGVSGKVAGEWAQDLGSMVSDLTTFATAIAKGDYVGAAIQALTSIFNWFTRNKRAAEEAAKATADYNKQFMFSQDGYGTRTVTQYSTGFLFWQTDHYDEQIDEVKKGLALSVESGFVNGFKDGFSKAIAANDFSLIGKSLKTSVGQSVLEGLEEAFIKGEIIKNILGPAIQNYLETGDDSMLDVAIEKAGAAAEQFGEKVLRPVADRFGLLGTDLAQDTTNSTTTTTTTPIQTVKFDLPSATASFDFSALPTLTSMIERMAPRIEAGGQALLEGSAQFGAHVSRLERILTNQEAKPNLRDLRGL